MTLGLSMLDWGIVLVLVISVLSAAAQGFFYELFALAGAVVGYLVAAWEYPRLAAWYMRYMNSGWAADIAGFLTVFLAFTLLAAWSEESPAWRCTALACAGLIGF